MNGFIRKLYTYQKMSFSTIRLVSKTGDILHSLNQHTVKINWALAKYFINAKSNVEINKLTPNQSITDDQVTKVISLKEKGAVKFNQFLRKMGKIISQGNTIYVESGVSNGKNIKIISSEDDSIKDISSLIESKSDLSNNDISIIFLTKDELNVKPFIFYSTEDRIILSNSKNTTALKEIIQKL